MAIEEAVQLIYEWQLKIGDFFLNGQHAPSSETWHCFLRRGIVHLSYDISNMRRNLSSVTVSKSS